MLLAHGKSILSSQQPVTKHVDSSSHVGLLAMTHAPGATESWRSRQ